VKFIDPRIDFAFRKIFGSEDTKDILIGFLESLLRLDGDRRIAELVLLDPFLVPKIKELSYSILDVQCRDHRGISYIVEMQIQKTSAFLKRIQYNAANAYVHQIEKGEDYPKLNQVIAITITDFILFDGVHHPVSRHESRETVTGISCLQEIVYYFIELPKFTRSLDELLDPLDQWIYFIRFAGSLEAIPEKIQSEPVRHAFQKALVANMTREEYDLYDKAGIAITDAQGAIQVARDEGLMAGHRSGRAEGLKEGRAEGRAEGRKEGELALLRRILQRKFGAELPDWVERQLDAAGADAIQQWSDRMFEAQTLEAVFSSDDTRLDEPSVGTGG